MAHGSALILPLAIVEGPIVTVLAGFLSAKDYFDWHWAFCLVICGDLAGDVICYGFGRAGGGPLAGLGRRLGVRRAITPALRHGLVHNSAKMLFIGKWTHSIGFLVLIGSGMLRVPLARFILVNLLASVPKCAVLFAVGMFAGDGWALAEHDGIAAIIALGAVGAVAMVLIFRGAGGIRAGGPRR
jgi:membrane protein DedA with SNARE-associated domain